MTEYDTGNRQSAFFGGHAYLSPPGECFPHPRLSSYHGRDFLNISNTRYDQE